MAAPSFTVEVVTPTRLVLKEEQAVSLTAPGIEGYFGVLANHAPLITELTVGELSITTESGKNHLLAVSGGFMEVHRNRVMVLADTAELAEEIDLARAEEAKRRAEERLRTAGLEVDTARAQSALARAVNRLRVAEAGRG